MALLLATAVAAEPPARQLSPSLRDAPIPEGASPYLPDGRTLSGDGVAIPCRCRFEGREVNVGERVCMATPNGTVLVRCELVGNITSWQPTETSCTVSDAGRARGAPMSRVAGYRPAR